jgi:hypothetical protein
MTDHFQSKTLKEDNHVSRPQSERIRAFNAAGTAQNHRGMEVFLCKVARRFASTEEECFMFRHTFIEQGFKIALRRLQYAHVSIENLPGSTSGEFFVSSCRIPDLFDLDFGLSRP